MTRPAITADAAAICAIYNHYVLETTITFEEAAVSPAEMESRIHGAAIQGFAYASKWKGRCAYRHSAEVTVYLDPKSIGRGIGTKLYEALLAELRRHNFHAVIGGIACPMRQASRCTSASASARSRISSRWAGSLAAGSTSATGSFCCKARSPLF